MSKWTSLSDTVTVTLVRSVYFGSEFLGHATAADLLTHFKDGIRQLDPKRLLQLEVLHWSGTRMQNTETSQTSEHRQMKSHGNSLNGHGKVMELYYQISVGTLVGTWLLNVLLRVPQLKN